MVAVGVVVHAVWPSVTLAAALALGAALGPTDAVAVSSLGKEASLSLRQLGVLKGESLFNDASGIVGFQFAIAAAITGEFAIGRAAGEFALSFIGGAVYGLVIALLANWLFETVRSLGWETTTTRILMELFLPFMLYLTAEELHVSGILAVVASGLFVRFDRTGIGPNVARTNIVSSSVWGVLSFSLNGAVFILLGMQLPKAMSASWDDPGVSNVRLSIVILLVSLVVVPVGGRDAAFGARRQHWQTAQDDAGPLAQRRGDDLRRRQGHDHPVADVHHPVHRHLGRAVPHARRVDFHRIRRHRRHATIGEFHAASARSEP